MINERVQGCIADTLTNVAIELVFINAQYLVVAFLLQTLIKIFFQKSGDKSLCYALVLHKVFEYRVVYRISNVYHHRLYTLLFSANSLPTGAKRVYSQFAEFSQMLFKYTYIFYKAQSIGCNNSLSNRKNMCRSPCRSSHSEPEHPYYK